MAILKVEVITLLISVQLRRLPGLGDVNIIFLLLPF